MGRLLDNTQLKLEEMEYKAYEIKGRAKQKPNNIQEQEAADTY